MDADNKISMLRDFFEQQGITQEEIARRLGVHKSYVNQLMTGNKQFGKGVAKKWSDQFGISYSWLLTGEGQMLNYQDDDRPKTAEHGSPCFDVSAIQGGTAHGTGMEQLMAKDALGMMSVPGMPVGDNIPYIQVRGSSMVNRRDPAHSIPEGAWIGIQPSQSSVIRWGEVYAVMTTDGPVVKKLMPSEREGYITCVSFNEEDGYLPYELPTNEIIQPLYKVVAVITAQRWA